MRVINMAHGEMLMLGAYTAYVVTDPNAFPSWLATWATRRLSRDIEFSLS